MIAFNLRSILNIGFVAGAENEYRFIDHFRIAEAYGPRSGSGGAAWLTGSTFMQSIASDGYPNISITNADNKTWAGGVRIPASFNYGAPGTGQYYVFKWKGIGEVLLSLNSGSWTWGVTEQALSSNITLVSGGNRFKNTSGADAYLVLSFTGPAQLFSAVFFASDPANTGLSGNRFREFSMYRKGEEADFLAGKVFRSAYKQTVVDFSPSAIRFMDWVGGNNSKLSRAEYRTLPTYAAWGGASQGGGQGNWVASPPYGETSGTNQYTIDSVTGTPAAPTHGEIATFRVGSGLVRSGNKTASAITKANPGVVTATAHGFNTGDIVVHQISAGMTQLDLRPCTITVDPGDPTNKYSVGIDTTSFSTFIAGTATQFTTLNIGLRGAHPIVFPSVTTFASHFGDAYMVTGDYKTAIFDKTVAMEKDSSGNYVYGVWMFNDIGAANGHNGGVPWEICAALVNEVNAMGPSSPVGIWMNVGHLGLLSMDDDYSAGSNLALQKVNVIRNGANGFAGVPAPIPLFIEYSNETWNTGGGNAVSQTFYCAYRGFLRWPASGTSDFSSMHSLRSVYTMEDIRGSAYYDANIHFVLAGQGTIGVSAGNAARIDGSVYYLTDPLNIWGGSSKPGSHHNHFAFAGYFETTTAFETANLSNYVTSWVGHIGDPASQETDCANYVAGLVADGVTTGEGTYRYGTLLLPAYGTKMASLAGTAIMYEGGWNRNIVPISAGNRVTSTTPYCEGVLDGSTNVITGVPSAYVTALSVGDFILGYGIPENTYVVSKPSSTSIELSNNTTVALATGQFIGFTPTNAYLRAAKRGRAWAIALVQYHSYFGTNSEYSSDYVQGGLRWGHNTPTAYGFGNTEWGDLDLGWELLGLRNNGEGQLLIRT